MIPEFPKQILQTNCNIKKQHNKPPKQTQLFRINKTHAHNMKPTRQKNVTNNHGTTQPETNQKNKQTNQIKNKKLDTNRTKTDKPFCPVALR